MMLVQGRITIARIAGTVLNIRVRTLEFLQRLSDCTLKWQHSLTAPGGSTEGSPLET